MIYDTQAELLGGMVILLADVLQISVSVIAIIATIYARNASKHAADASEKADHITVMVNSRMDAALAEIALLKELLHKERGKE